MEVLIWIFKCTGIIGQDLIHPYIQSTTVLCDYTGGTNVGVPVGVSLSVTLIFVAITFMVCLTLQAECV